MNKHIGIFVEFLKFICFLALIIGIMDDNLFVMIFYGICFVLSIVSKELIIPFFIENLNKEKSDV